MFDILVITYLFLGGAGSGALVVLSIIELLTAFGRITLPANILGNAWMLCLGFLSLGVTCLFVDLGKPDNIIYLLMSPAPTPITIGAYALTLAIVLAGLFLLMEKTGLLDFSPVIWCVLAGISCLVGLVSSCYTGVLLQTMPSVLAWQTPLIPLLFMLSSLSSGCAIVLLAVVFSDGRTHSMQITPWILKGDTVVIGIEAVALSALMVWMCTSASTMLGAQAALQGQLAGPFWLMVAVGLAAPLVLEQPSLFQNTPTKVAVVAVMVLIGCFALRWCVVGLSEFDPTYTCNLFHVMGIYGQ